MTSPHPTLGSLPWQRAVDRPDLLADPVALALADWVERSPDVVDLVSVVEIDPGLADTTAMTEAYDLPLEASVNCVLVGGRREGVERLAAALVRATTRADVNTTLKRLLDVRKASFLPMDRAVTDTGMEHGGITPIGLPPGHRLLLDRLVVDGGLALVGSGLRRSKLLLPGTLLATLPGAEVIDGLGLAVG